MDMPKNIDIGFCGWDFPLRLTIVRCGGKKSAIAFYAMALIFF